MVRERLPERCDPQSLVPLVPSFSALPREDVWLLAHTARVTRAARGTVLFEAGATANDVWVLRCGGVRLVQTVPDSSPFVLRVIGPGELFGADTLAREPRYSVSAVTLCFSDVLSWNRRAILKLMDTYPSFSASIVQLFARRVEDFRTRYRELATDCVEQRLARTLLRTHARWQEADRKRPSAPPSVREGAAAHVDAGASALDLPLSRHDLAQIAGTTVYTVSRILQHWQRLGIVHAGRMRLSVLRPAALAEQAARAAAHRASARAAVRAAGDQPQMSAAR